MVFKGKTKSMFSWLQLTKLKKKEKEKYKILNEVLINLGRYSFQYMKKIIFD